MGIVRANTGSCKSGTAATKLRRAVMQAAKLREKGMGLQEIADTMKVSVACVYRYIKRAHEIWATKTADSHDVHVQRELAKLDTIEIEATLAWERSIGKFVTVSEKSTAEGLETTTKTENLAGDPRFLAQMDKCVEARRKLLGLDAPTKQTLSNPDGTPLLTGIKVIEVGSQS